MNIKKREQQRLAEQGKLQALAEETALYLGAPWEYQGPSEYAWIARIVNETAEILFRTVGSDAENRRVRVTGFYPGNHLPWGTDMPSITVAMSRGAEVLAKEIQRRFLSKYLTLFGENQKNKLENEARLIKEEEAQTVLLDLLHGTFYAGRVIHFAGPGDSRGTAEVYGDTVKYELRGMSIASAFRLAETLQQMRVDRGEA